jgi:hypothetical protein
MEIYADVIYHFVTIYDTTHALAYDYCMRMSSAVDLCYRVKNIVNK